MDMDKPVVIKIRDLRRSFHISEELLEVLKGINLDIKEGEFVTIMGPSGSGKSTLLNILGCLDKATQGLYELDGVDLSKMDNNELAEVRNKKLGFIFQSYNLLPRTSALENVELPLYYDKKVNQTERRKRAIEQLNIVGLNDRMDFPPSKLSGGQQQRVAIARSLVNEPRLILADEATGNLDTKTSYEIMAILQKLHRDGKTIVFVTHEQDIAAFSERTIVLRDGIIVKDTLNQHIASASEKLDELKKIKTDADSKLI